MLPQCYCTSCLEFMLCSVQELLDHAFLRPTEGPARPVPGQVGLTRDQLKKLLTQVRLPCMCIHCLLALAPCSQSMRFRRQTHEFLSQHPDRDTDGAFRSLHADLVQMPG